MKREELKHTDPMPYGIYQGWLLGDVPADWLLDHYHEGKPSPRLSRYIQDNIDQIQNRLEGRPNWTDELQ